MALEWRTSVLGQYVVDKIKAISPSPFDGVFYGDQDRLPGGTILCVEPSTRNRELTGIPRRTDVTLQFFLIVYINKLQESEPNRLESDQQIEDLEEFLHTDPTMGGQVIHSMVTQTESGFRVRDNTLIRATRLTLEMLSKQSLPQTQ